MEYTGISKVKEKFVPRKSKEEFFRDGEVIKELYEWTDNAISKECSVLPLPYDDTLCVFNEAYRICWLVVQGECSARQIEDSFSPASHSWAVAEILLELNAKFGKIAGRRRMDVAWTLITNFCQLHYDEFVPKTSLMHPIYFCAPLPEPVDPSKAWDYMNQVVRLTEENRRLRKQLDKATDKLRALKYGVKFDIAKLGQLNPAATEIHNHYHNS